jgi:uncharacterized membrane protein (DUF106 family)
MEIFKNLKLNKKKNLMLINNIKLYKKLFKEIIKNEIFIIIIWLLLIISFHFSNISVFEWRNQKKEKKNNQFIAVYMVQNRNKSQN